MSVWQWILLSPVCLSLIGASFRPAVAHIAFEENGPPTPQGTQLAELSAVLEVEQLQALQGGAGGLHFCIGLFNHSKKDVSLKNPLDFLDYLLIDGSGRILQLPPRGIKFLINTRSSPETHSFRVVSLEVGGEEVTDRDSNGRTVTVPGGEAYRMSLMIEEVRTSDADMSPVPISSGDYTFCVFLALVSAGADGDRMLRTPTTQIALRNLH